MQVHQYFQDENTRTFCPSLFDGRWSWHRTNSLHKKKYPYNETCAGIRFVDLFGRYPEFEFGIKTTDWIKMISPLTRHFILLRCYYDIHDSYEYFQIAKLDWDTEEGVAGEFMTSPGLSQNFPYYNEEHERYKVLTDRNVDSSIRDKSSFNFLFYNKTGDQLECLYFEVDCEKLAFKQLGESFKIPKEKFQCLNLKNGVLRGISSNLDVIKFFDVKERRILDQIGVNGLPKELSSEENEILKVFAWSDTKFFLRKVEGKDQETHSTIYFVNINENESDCDVSAMSHKFDGKIDQLVVGPDNFLYVGLRKCLEWLKFVPMHGPDVVYDVLRSGYRQLFQFFRVPIGEPESLLFLSASAAPKPLPPVAQKIVDQRDYIPSKFY